MSMNDPISDMLSRIRNAQAAEKDIVLVPASNVKKAILSVLQQEGYINGFEDAQDERGHPAINVELKYYQGKPVITKLQRYSKPGLRQYSASKEIPMVSNGLGVTIVSTSHGVMSDTEARSKNFGGEVLCQVF